MKSTLPGQLDIPQTEERPLAAAMLRGDMPLKPKTAQKPCDIGLFSDEADQLDLIEMFMD